MIFNSTVIKSEPVEVRAPEPSPTNRHTPDEDPTSVSVIKIEHTDPSDNEDDDKRSDVDDLDRNKLYPTLDGHTNDTSLATRISLVNTNAATAAIAVNDKYCHGCDIKFSSQSTFIAHKRFYCKNVQNDFDGASATATNQTAAGLPATRSSPNQTSVVT